jgi:hypothetical protein
MTDSANTPDDPILYRWSASFGRMGHLNGISLCTASKLRRAAGHVVFFGEVLGKHSEVFYEVDEADFYALTSDQDFISKARELGLLDVGADPIDALGDWCPVHESYFSDQDAAWDYDSGDDPIMLCPACHDEKSD